MGPAVRGSTVVYHCFVIVDPYTWLFSARAPLIYIGMYDPSFVDLIARSLHCPDLVISVAVGPKFQQTPMKLNKKGGHTRLPSAVLYVKGPCSWRISVLPQIQ